MALDPGIRTEAAMRLADIGHGASDAVGALTVRLVDQNPIVRECAAFALAEIGRPARAAIPALQEACDDDLSVATTAITLRQAYADAPGQATFVWNMRYPAQDAAEELDALFRELLPEAISAKVVAMRSKRATKTQGGAD